ncbi:MAG: condensation protein, partial [Saccharothrix sp.]|nr:condensation protein [Saccharothrix sp.]
TAQDYRHLVAALPGDWRITLSQEREPLAGIAASAARFRADLDAEGLRPDLVAGWSMGGQVAFEFACGFDDTPPGLVLVDVPPPVGADLVRQPVWHRLGDFAETVCLTLGVRLDGSPLTVRHEPAGDADDVVRTTLAELAARLRCAGVEVTTRALANRWDTYHRHVSAVAGFTSDRVLAAPCVVVAADLPDEGVAAWADRFTSTPDTLRVAADHYSVLAAPAVDAVAAAVARAASLADTSTQG